MRFRASVLSCAQKRPTKQSENCGATMRWTASGGIRIRVCTVSMVRSLASQKSNNNYVAEVVLSFGRAKKIRKRDALGPDRFTLNHIVMAGLDPSIQPTRRIAPAYQREPKESLDGRLPPTPRLWRASVRSLGRRSFSEGGRGGHDG